MADINTIIRNRAPEFLDLLEQSLEQWHERSFRTRQSIFPRTTLAGHLEAEIEAQNVFLAKEKEKGFNHSDFDFRLIFKAVAKRRAEFINYMEDKLEDLNWGDVPFITKVINLNTSPIVINRYYSLVPQPSKNEVLPPAYVGKHENFNPPYYLNVYGAFVLSKDWEHLNYKRENKIRPYDKLLAEEVETALKIYGKGFRKGFFNFEQDILGVNDIRKILDNKYYAIEVFDYVVGSFFGRGGYPESYGVENVLAGWHDAGIEAGRYYRAWYEMLRFSKVFEPMFLEAQKATVDKLEVDDNYGRLNNFVRSTVEDYCEPLVKELSNPKQYVKLVTQLENYFSDAMPSQIITVHFKYGNKKNVASALGQLHRALVKESIGLKYLGFVKQLVNLFNEEMIDDRSVNNTNLYKYLTSKR